MVDGLHEDRAVLTLAALDLGERLQDGPVATIEVTLYSALLGFEAKAAFTLTGSADPSDRESKKNNYDVVQKLAAQFEEKNGSLICGQLLGLDGDVSKVHPKYAEGTTPEPRTQEYYKKRPCIELVGQVCDILDSYFGEKIQEETKG